MHVNAQPDFTGSFSLLESRGILLSHLSPSKLYVRLSPHTASSRFLLSSKKSLFDEATEVLAAKELSGKISSYTHQSMDWQIKTTFGICPKSNMVS
jgi:hypothetical protein